MLHHTSGAPTILLIDDSPVELDALSGVLCQHYVVRAVRTGRRALKALHKPPWPDLILLEPDLPDMDGCELLRELGEDPVTAEIPVICYSAPGTEWEEDVLLGLGAVDCVIKPGNARAILNRVRTHLELADARRALRRTEARILRESARRADELVMAQDVCIRALARLAEADEPRGGNHLRRMQAYLDTLARQLSHYPRYADLAPTDVAALVRVAPLHDIGKMAIPRNILLKPGRLSPREWAIAKTHSQLGRDAIAAAGHGFSESLPFLRLAQEVAYCHHERWDGSGYPQGLCEERIPLSARLMAVADVLDALVSRRTYKEAYPFEAAVEIMRESRGSQFDPAIFDAFSARLDDFAAITRRLPDHSSMHA
ncbi:HD-GYP domain-containing protein [Thiorhodococcus minor]|uniref:Response regulator n=1 Tax=Thiorhodococcus minor TaxID=57489 RepID=A0A6M0JZ46_9GAMM|nr:HD domain-containing phosphohydrolase [Thiorhodococcus minor]NEV62766.1 response regulator [Thiorhodococcus minor]